MRASRQLAIAFFLMLAMLSWTQTDKDADVFHPTLDSSTKYGYYIPIDLDDALKELDKGFSASEKAHIKSMKSQDGMIEYHMGLGMWLRNNWELWAGGRLYKSLAMLGLKHPDDMSALMLEEYWRKLHNQPLDTDAFIAKAKQSWIENQNAPAYKCPWDKSDTEMTMGFGHREVVKGFPGMVWFCRCKHGHLWAWHYKKGWFRPEGALLKEFHDSEAKERAENAKG